MTRFQSAQTFQLAGDYDRAAAEYREAIALALEQLGNLRVSHQDYADGAGLLSQAVQISPNLSDARIDLGIAKFRAGDLEAASAEAEAVLAKDTQNSRALNLAGKIFFLQGNYEAAAERLQKALQLDPDFDIGYTLALAQLELKKPAEAGIIFDEMLNSSKPSSSLEALIGIAYRETGYPDQAIAHLKRSVALDAKSARSHIALGLAYFLKGADHYSAAREEFLTGLAITPGDYTACYYNGVMAAAEKKPSEAAKWFEQAAASGSGDPDVYFRLGQARFDAKDYERAVAALRRGLQLSQAANGSGEPLVHELLGKALEALGRNQEAQAELDLAKRVRERAAGDSRQATQPASSAQAELRHILLQGATRQSDMTPQEDRFSKETAALLAQSYDNLGVIDARAARFANAASEFAQAARWNPELPDIDRKWGMAAFRAEQYDQAIPPLERQLQRTPGDLHIREMLGVSYFMKDRFADASRVFTPELDRLSGNAGVLYAAGVSLSRSGNSAGAAKMFARMLKENSNVPQVHLLLGQAHSESGEYAEAVTELSRALELDPKLPEAHYSRGIVRFKQGQMDEAAREFQAELALNANSLPSLYQLAVVRLAQQQRDEAIGLLKRVLQESPGNPDARYQLGKALLEKGDVKGAIENLEASVRTQPKDYSYYQLSLAYRRDGRLPDAQQALRMYEQLKRKPASGNPAQ